MPIETVLAFTGTDEHRNDFLRTPPRVGYNADEQRLSVFVQSEIKRLVIGGRDQLVLLKLYPRRGDDATLALRAGGPDGHAGNVRPDVAARIATDMLGFFEPLRGGVITQEVQDDLIVQQRPFSTTYPHINLQRYDFYDAEESTPLLAAWCAVRIQNQRRETRTNRMIDLTLLVVEVGQAVLPRLLR